MNSNRRKIVVTVLVLFVALSALAAQAVREIGHFSADVINLEAETFTTKYGNLNTDGSAQAFTDCGLSWGDIVRVSFLDEVLLRPVVPAYSYVDAGCPAVIVEKDLDGNPTGFVRLAINLGDFTTSYGIATKTTNEDKTWVWTACDGVTFPLEFDFSLEEKGGYLAQYILHELVISHNRSDYPELSDEQYANFRMVGTTGMHGKLFRSSNPVNAELGRNTQADAACREAGITTVLNLADDKATAEGRNEFQGTYYSTLNIAYLNLGLDFTSDEFAGGLAEGLRFLAANPGKYLVHCKEGKDRAGFTCAILECLMGASIQEVLDDYMQTYINYYKVEKGSDKYMAIEESNIIKSLCKAFGTDDIYNADLAACAKDYLLSIGLNGDDISALKANL